MSSPPTIQAVVFDLDGLMFNTEELYQFVGSEVLRRRGKNFDLELLHQIMGRPGRIALQMMIDYHQLLDTVEQLAAENDELFVELLETRLETMPGLLPLLDALEAAEIPKAIATSSGRRFTENVLARFHLQPRFKYILTSEDITHGKPHPEIYLLAAERHGVSPERMLVFEDSANGCAAAVAAGTQAIAVPGGHSLAHNFPGAALVAESLADPRIYERLGIVPGTNDVVDG